MSTIGSLRISIGNINISCGIMIIKFNETFFKFHQKSLKMPLDVTNRTNLFPKMQLSTTLSCTYGSCILLKVCV